MSEAIRQPLSAEERQALKDRAQHAIDHPSPVEGEYPFLELNADVLLRLLCQLEEAGRDAERHAQLEGQWSAMCERLQGAVRRHRLGLGGERVDVLVIKALDRALSPTPHQEPRGC